MKISMLFSPPGVVDFRAPRSSRKRCNKLPLFPSTSVKTRLIDVGPPAGFSHLLEELRTRPAGSICQGQSLGPFRPVRYQATLRRPRGRPGRGEEYVSLQTPPIRILYWSRQCFLVAAEIVSQMLHEFVHFS